MDNKLKVGILLFDEVEVLDFAGPYEVFSIARHQDSEENLFDVKTVAESKGIISARNGLKIMPDLNFGGKKLGELGVEQDGDSVDDLKDELGDELEDDEGDDSLELGDDSSPKQKNKEEDLTDNQPADKKAKQGNDLENELKVDRLADLGDKQESAHDFDLLIVPGGRGASEIEIHNSRMIEWLKVQSCQVRIMASVCTGAFLLAEAGLLEGKNATTHWSAIERLQQDYPGVKVQSYLKYVDEGEIITAAGISAGIDMSLYLLKKLFNEDLAKYTSRRMEFMGEFS